MDILIVEGDHEVGKVLGDVLEALGHQFELASCHVAALKAAMRGNFDACVIDVDMGRGSAERLLETLRLRNPSIRAVAISAVRDLWSLQGSNPQFDFHLDKPVSIAWICAAIEGEPSD